MSLKYGVPVWAHVFWEWAQDTTGRYVMKSSNLEGCNLY